MREWRTRREHKPESDNGINMEAYKHVSMTTSARISRREVIDWGDGESLIGVMVRHCLG